MVVSIGYHQPSGMRVSTERARYDHLEAQLRNERQSWWSTWRDLADYIMPSRPRFLLTDQQRGKRKSEKIIDSTATLASRTLASGMMAGVTSPARPWFRLTVGDPVLADLEDVKAWLDVVTRRMREMFLRTNIYQKLPHFYRELGTFGTSVIFIEEDFDHVLRAYEQPIGSFMVGNDERMRPTVFMRVFRLTVRQVIEKFGRTSHGSGEDDVDWTNISHQVQSLWKTGNTEAWVEVVHLVVKNDNYDEQKTEARFKKYKSVYYETGAYSTIQQASPMQKDKFLRESGYDIFPVLVGRWEVSGEDVYGIDCPGMTALGDIKQLQIMEKRSLQAVEKQIHPPLKGPSSLSSVRVSLLPGDITYTNEREGQKGLSPIHEVRASIAEIEAKQQQARSRIRRAYFEDLFLMLAQSDRRQITAREIDERHEEKLLALGSVLEQLNQDVLDPLIDLAFDIMFRQGMIPEPPDQIAGMPLKVEYTSILAQAQKASGLGSLDRFTAYAGQVAQFKPEVLDKVDVDALLGEYADVTGVPPRILVPQEQVDAIRNARLEAQQAQVAAAQAQQAVSSAKELGQASTDEGTLLGELLERGEAGTIQP